MAYLIIDYKCSVQFKYKKIIMSPENFIYQNIHKSLYLFYYYQEITNEQHTSSVNKSKARQKKRTGQDNQNKNRDKTQAKSFTSQFVNSLVWNINNHRAVHV